MYSIERLVHFRCPVCDRWWTVGDAPIDEKLDWFCTWCGALTVKTVPMESEEYRLGRIAYEAYCESIGWKSAIGRYDLPPFDKALGVVQRGWITAAKAVKQHKEE